MSSNSRILLWCALAWLLLVPLLALPLLVLLSFALLRKTLDAWVRLRHPSWRPIYPPDNPCWFQRKVQTADTDPAQKCLGNIAGLLSVEQVVDIAELRQAVLQRLLEPKVGADWRNWKMHVVPRGLLGYFYWRPVELKVEQHVWEYLPKQQETFEAFVATWVSRGFCGRPLWEFVLARPKDGALQGKTVVMVKFSHAIGDGVLLKLLLEALCHQEHAPEIAKMTRSWAQALFHVATLPWALYKLRLLTGKDHFHLKPGPNSESVLLFDSTQLQQIKAVARATRVPFRQVLSCTYASALRRYLLESRKASELAQYIGAGVALPALRFTRSFELFANRGTACFFSYPLGVSCPLERLRLAHADYAENLRTGQHQLNFFGTYLAYVLPCLLKAGGMTLMTSDVFSEQRPRLFGKHLTSSCTYGAMSLEGLPYSSLGCFYTCQDTVAFSLTSRKELIPDEAAAQRLCAYFKQELQELLLLATSSANAELASLPV